MKKIHLKPFETKAVSFWDKSVNNEYLEFSLKSKPVIVVKFKDIEKTKNIAFQFNCKNTENNEVFLTVNIFERDKLKKLMDFVIDSEYRHYKITLKNTEHLFNESKNFVVFVLTIDSNLVTNDCIILNNLHLEYFRED